MLQLQIMHNTSQSPQKWILDGWGVIMVPPNDESNKILLSKRLKISPIDFGEIQEIYLAEK